MRPLRKSIKRRGEMLRQAQHDNKGLFCHSEEQRDEESRGYAKLSLPMREKLSGGRIKCFIDAQVSQYMFDVTACFRIGDGFYEYILIA